MMVSKPIVVSSPLAAKYRFYAKLPKLSSRKERELEPRRTLSSQIISCFSRSKAKAELCFFTPVRVFGILFFQRFSLRTRRTPRFQGFRWPNLTARRQHEVRHHHQARHDRGADRRAHAPGGSVRLRVRLDLRFARALARALSDAH